MGKEAQCVVRVNGVTGTSKLHLDSNELRISGTPRITVPLAHVTGVNVEGNSLYLTSPGGPIELQLGAAVARKWAQAIAQPKTRFEKLQVRTGDRVCVRNVSDADFLEELARAVTSAPLTALRGIFDVVFQGLAVPADLAQIARARAHLAPAGALWLIHPKGRTAAIKESDVRAALFAAGLFDSKVVAFSTTHTATKAAIPLKSRVPR